MTQVSQQLSSLFSNLYPECFRALAPLHHSGFISFKQIQNIPEHDRGHSKWPSPSFEESLFRAPTPCLNFTTLLLEKALSNTTCRLQSGYEEILKGYYITLQKAKIKRLRGEAETLVIFTKDENTENWKAAATAIQHLVTAALPAGFECSVEIMNYDKMYREYFCGLRGMGRSEKEREISDAIEKI
jgi:hypothetical protein